MWSLQQGAEDGRTAGRQNAAAVRQSLHQSFRSLVASPSGETRLFVEYVERVRADPEVNCSHFCTRLRLDNAGEWAADYHEFQQACINLRIEVLQPPSATLRCQRTG